jgi:hypothetical protein
MKRSSRLATRLMASAASALLVFMLLPTPAREAAGPEVSVGQPSMWSFAQAHYLLSPMRFRNRTLDGKVPSDDDLDPNAVRARRVDALRTLLNAGVAFDQTALVKKVLVQISTNGHGEAGHWRAGSRSQHRLPRGHRASPDPQKLELSLRRIWCKM